jgi:ABC-type phosphate/phosphonate transport system substrate-binding protein
MKKFWGGVALLAVMPGAWAQGLIMGVSEGTSGGLDHAQVVTKYQGLADVVGRSIKQKVNVVFAREFSALEEGMKTGRYDFVIARPSDYPARGLRDYGYKFVASAKPDGQCFIIVPKDSPIKSLAEVKGKRIALPEPAAYMTKFCRAELRDKGIDTAGPNVQYVREQGAVAFYLENKFADVGGVASYSGVARKWEKDGNRVIHKSVPQPYFPLIAGKKISTAQVEAIQKSLVAMNGNPADEQVLKTVGIKEFDVSSEKRLSALLNWLGL